MERRRQTVHDGQDSRLREHDHPCVSGGGHGVRKLRLLSGGVRTVAWSLLGVRGSSGAQQDASAAHPVLVLAVGFGLVVALVAGLVAVVHWVV